MSVYGIIKMSTRAKKIQAPLKKVLEEFNVRNADGLSPVDKRILRKKLMTVAQRYESNMEKFDDKLNAKKTTSRGKKLAISAATLATAAALAYFGAGPGGAALKGLGTHVFTKGSAQWKRFTGLLTSMKGHAASIKTDLVANIGDLQKSGPLRTRVAQYARNARNAPGKYGKLLSGKWTATAPSRARALGALRTGRNGVRKTGAAAWGGLRNYGGTALTGLGIANYLTRAGATGQSKNTRRA